MYPVCVMSVVTSNGSFDFDSLVAWDRSICDWSLCGWIIGPGFCMTFPRVYEEQSSPPPGTDVSLPKNGTDIVDTIFAQIVSLGILCI